MKITVLSQKLIVFCDLVNKYYCLLFLYRDTCAENVNITSRAYNGIWYGVKTKKYYRLCSEKALKSARYTVILISEISIWTMAEKETRTKWNIFSQVYVFPFCGPAAHYDLKALLTCKNLFTKPLCMSYWVSWSIRTLIIYFPTYIFHFSYLSARHFRHTVLQNHVL